jgi:5-(carboxyamino)imidazole ribonucleotide mutase
MAKEAIRLIKERDAQEGRNWDGAKGRREKRIVKDKFKQKAAEKNAKGVSTTGPPVSPSAQAPLVAVIMGSKSDWETMRHADQTLTEFGVDHINRVMSAHRTPQLALEFASNADGGGIEVIIAAAGGAAHLAGMLAAHTTLPVLGVPMKSDALNGMDSLLSTVQMPAGIPVGTLAIGKPGAINAALFAIAILANSRPVLREKLRQFRARQEKQIRETSLE